MMSAMRAAVAEERGWEEEEEEMGQVAELGLYPLAGVAAATVVAQAQPLRPHGLGAGNLSVGTVPELCQKCTFAANALAEPASVSV